MAASLQLLDSDNINVFVSQNFGNIIAGANSSEKLLFVNSNGDATANDSEFGFLTIPANDGVNFAHICAAAAMNTETTTISGAVVNTGGSIPDGTTVTYKISVLDSWDWESAVGSVYSFTTTISTGVGTNKINLSWTAITGAAQYGVYREVSGGGFRLIALTSVNSYTDLNYTPTATEPPAPGTSAHKAGTYGVVPVACGNLTVGSSFPVILREVVPGGTLAAGNPRQHNLYVAFP